MGTVAQLQMRAETKEYHCLVCKKKIGVRNGFCDICYQAGKTTVRCNRCQETFTLGPGTKLTAIHPHIIPGATYTDTIAKLFMVGACKECDPDSNFSRVLVTMRSIPRVPS